MIKRIWLVWMIALKVLDVLTTYIGLSFGATEMNVFFSRQITENPDTMWIGVVVVALLYSVLLLYQRYGEENWKEIEECVVFGRILSMSRKTLLRIFDVAFVGSLVICSCHVINNLGVIWWFWWWL